MKRRSFSGKPAGLSQEDKQANIASALGLSKNRPTASKHVVLMGESLRSVAEKLYQDPDYWLLLVLKNDLPTTKDRYGNPVTQLRRGQTLKLPDGYEIESFERDPQAPVVVSLFTDDLGFRMPRTRFCGSCQRETLAMAVDCVSCGVDMDYLADDETEDAGKEAAGNEALSAEDADDEDADDEDADDEDADDEDDDDETEEVDLEEAQARTLPRVSTIESQKAQAPSASIAEQGQDHTIVSKLRPPLEQEQTVIVPAASSAGADSFWTATPVPEFLQTTVRVVESLIAGDRNGLTIALQLQAQGKWTTIYEYHVFADEVQIIQYHQNTGRKRMKKSLPAKQTKKMAWNHFRSNWKSICNEYWAT